MNKRLICFFIILCVLLPSLVFTSNIVCANDYNKQMLDYSNVTQWHQLGYTGKGVTIIVNDNFNDYTFHGERTMELLKIIAPDVRVIQADRPYPKTAVRLARENNAQIINRSLNTESWEWFNNDNTLNNAYKDNIFMTGSTGNDGVEGISNEYLRDKNWFSVGAVNLINGVPKRPAYSSWGEGIDVVGLTGWDTSYGSYHGTSASNPYISGLVALFQQRFKERNGRFATISEVKDFIYSNCIDLESKGYDIYTGYGLFILPRLCFIDEVVREKGNYMATKAYRKDGTPTYIYIPFAEDMIKNLGYRLRR